MNILLKNTLVILMCSMVLYSCQSSNANQSDTEQQHKDREEASHHEASNIVWFTQQQQEAIGLTLGNIKKRSLRTSLKVSGKLTIPPQYRAKVSPLVSGVVKKIAVREGNYVQKGQTLAILQNPDYIELQQNFQKAASKLQFLEKEFERKQTLYEKEVGSAKAFQKAKADYQSAKANYDGLKEKLNLLGLNPASVSKGKISSSISLKSPINGYITTIHVSTGQYVSPKEELFDIRNNDKLFADFKVYEQDIQKVKEGQTIQFTLAHQPNHFLKAKVTAIGKALDKDNRTIHVHAKILESVPNMLSGMYVNGRILADSIKVKALPKSAIVSEGHKHFIFIKDTSIEAGSIPNEKATAFKMIEVATGISNQQYTEVRLIKPLHDDIQVVIDGAYYLQADMSKEENTHSH